MSSWRDSRYGYDAKRDGALHKQITELLINNQ